MSRLRTLAASCMWTGLIVAGFSLTACGVGSIEDGSNTSNTSDTTETAIDIAGSTAEEVTTSWMSDTGVVFVRQKPTEGMGAVMQALAKGRVVLDDAGCIRLESGAYDGDLIVWPPGYSIRTEGGEIHIIKEDGETLVRVGERVEF